MYLPDGNGPLPIHYGCEHGTLSTLKLLVSNGAKVNILDHSGKLPIDYAQKNRNFDSNMRNFLLKNTKSKILETITDKGVLIKFFDGYRVVLLLRRYMHMRDSISFDMSIQPVTTT